MVKGWRQEGNAAEVCEECLEWVLVMEEPCLVNHRVQTTLRFPIRPIRGYKILVSYRQPHLNSGRRAGLWPDLGWKNHRMWEGRVLPRRG